MPAGMECAMRLPRGTGSTLQALAPQPEGGSARPGMASQGRESGAAASGVGGTAPGAGTAAPNSRYTMPGEAWVRRWVVRQARGAGPVVDIGCGQGELCRDLARAGVAVTGVDIDPAQLQAAQRSSAGPWAVPPQWVCDDGEQLLRLGTETFGAVTMVFVLHHMQHPRAGLRAGWRVLRPGGRLIVAEMLPKGPERGDACHRISLRQWMVWLTALQPVAMRLLAPEPVDWLVAMLQKPTA